MRYFIYALGVYYGMCLLVIIVIAIFNWMFSDDKPTKISKKTAKIFLIPFVGIFIGIMALISIIRKTIDD